MFSRLCILLLLTVQIETVSACSFSSVNYKVIKESRWDRRPLAQALREDYSVKFITSSDNTKLALNESTINRKLKIHLVEGSTLLYFLRYPVLGKNEVFRNIYSYTEVFRRKKTLKGLSKVKVFVGRFLIWQIKNPEQSIKFNQLKMIGFSDYFRRVSVFERFNKVTKRTVYSAFVSDYYTNGMSHCGGIFPILLHEAKKYCPDSQRKQGTCRVI